jgi:hypothetical protein
MFGYFGKKLVRSILIEEIFSESAYFRKMHRENYCRTYETLEDVMSGSGYTDSTGLDD